MATGALVGLDLNPYDGACFREMNLVFATTSGTSDVVARGAAQDDITNALILPPGPDCPTPAADGVIDVIETEMVSLDLTSGTVRLRAGAAASVTLPKTLGAIIQDPGNPLEGCSYFDVFFEIETPCGKLYNHTPFRVVATITEVAPLGGQYFHPIGLCLDLFPTPPGTINWPVAQLVDALHLTQEPIILGCTNPLASNFNPAATVDDGSCCFPVAGPGPFWFADLLQLPPATDNLLTGAVVCLRLAPPLPPDTIEVALVGPTDVSRFPDQPGVVGIQIQQMDLTGSGGVRITAGLAGPPGLPPSNGFIQDHPDPLLAQSGLGMFVAVEVPGLPPLFNDQPIQLEALLDQVPPQTVYEGAPTMNVPLFDQLNPPPTAQPFAHVIKVRHFTKIIPGCTDPAALNYNPSATFDDGSCFYPADLCRPPEGLLVNPLVPTAGNLTWHPIYGAQGYEIQGGIVGAGGITTLTTIFHEYLVTPGNLSPGVTYWWQVRTLCCPAFGGGLSPWSLIDTFTTPTCPIISPIFSSMITATTAKLNWTPNPNLCVDGYRLIGGVTGSGSFTSINVNSATASSFTATGLNNGTSYAWTCVCRCIGVVGDPLASPVDTFQTLPAPAEKSEELIQPSGLMTSLYPNPASESVKITWLGAKDEIFDIEVYDINGRVMLAGSGIDGSNGSTTLDVSQLSNGVYQLLIRSDAVSTARKLIIAK